jgi:hypothetical protein
MLPFKGSIISVTMEMLLNEGFTFLYSAFENKALNKGMFTRLVHTCIYIQRSKVDVYMPTLCSCGNKANIGTDFNLHMQPFYIFH